MSLGAGREGTGWHLAAKENKPVIIGIDVEKQGACRRSGGATGGEGDTRMGAL